MTDMPGMIARSSLGGPIPLALRLAGEWDRAAIGESHGRAATFRQCASELRKTMMDLPEFEDLDVIERTFLVSEVAESFGVTTYTVRDWLKTGKIKGIKTPGHKHWRIPESELRKFSTEYFGTGDNQ